MRKRSEAECRRVWTSEKVWEKCSTIYKVRRVWRSDVQRFQRVKTSKEE